MSGRYVLSDDPAYPVARYRRGGNIELFLEVTHDDEDGQALADEVWAAVGRFLHSKGAELEGGSVGYKATGLWLDDDQLGGKPETGSESRRRSR